MIMTVRELIEELSKFEIDSQLRVIDTTGFVLMPIHKIDMDCGRLTIFPEYKK